MPVKYLHIDLSEKPTPEEKLRVLIRISREVSGLSQTQMANKIGTYFGVPSMVSQQTISHWECTGNVPGCYLGAIAAVTGQDWDIFKV